MLIGDPAGLARVCAAMRAAGSFALDTEFHREGTYFPRVYLVQVAAGETVAAIDPLAVPDLAPLVDLVADPAVRKVVHAGRQDFEIFATRYGRPPANVLDTQVAAALVGRGDEIGYGNLLEKCLGVSLPKIETFTDWSRRPLTEAQLKYAIDDVRYLPPLAARLEEDLRAMGRLEWMREECRIFEDPATYESDPRSQALKFRGVRGLSPRAVAILRELAAWRDEEAARRDVPRGRVIADDVLVEVARRPPASAAELGKVRGLRGGEAERCAPGVLRAIERGRVVPSGEIPALPPSRADDPERAILVDFLEDVMGVRAREAKIAPAYLATRSELARLVESCAERPAAAVGQPEIPAPPDGEHDVLRGWRRELVGEDLLRALEGRIDLGVDPATGNLTIRERPAQRG